MLVGVPSAHSAPLFPAILAGLLRLFGDGPAFSFSVIALATVLAMDHHFAPAGGLETFAEVRMDWLRRRRRADSRKRNLDGMGGLGRRCMAGSRGHRDGKSVGIIEASLSA